MLNLRLEKIVLQINDFCNFKCPQCIYSSISTHSEDMPLEMIKLIIEEAIKNNVQEIKLLGLSEPTLHQKFNDVMKELSDAPINVHILSNGSTLTNSSILNSLVNNSISRIEFSVDAFYASTYKIIRGGNKLLFSEIKNNIITLCNLKKEETRVGVSMVNHEESLSEEDLFIEYWIDKVDYVRIRNAHNFSGKAKKLKSAKRIDNYNNYECGFMKERIFIDNKGNVYPCKALGAPILGNILENKLECLWESSERLGYLKKITLNENGNPFCNDCNIFCNVPDEVIYNEL